ncbi:WSC domain-containing protein [Rutstroemia sp. NJR-2017a WRK4]|nr:WSC domain-containing protein [Rutstroemia sp. NJR-2017a WRK4]
MRGINFVQILALAGTAHGFWRMPCRERVGLARIDPLVNFGAVSEHSHTIHGSNGFGETARTAELLAGNCTTCGVSQDKSAYWTPPLYFKDASTGKFEMVEQVGGMLAYYLLYPNAGETHVTAFPTNFTMIAGTNDLRNFSNYPVPDVAKSNWNKAPYNTQAFLQQAALGFNCLNYKKDPEGSLYRHFLPDKAYLDANCADGVRFELMFPSCWNQSAGVSPSDGKSHMAYPSEVMTGDCPKGFDTRVVSLFYETIWNTANYIGRDGEFIISNGDPTGYGYHGDFIMGWDEDFLQSAVNTCTNASGQITDCPLFDIQTDAEYGSCSMTMDMPESLTHDNVTGPMATLPGNCAIQSGPAPASSMASGATSAAGTSAHSSATSSAASSSITSTAAIVPTLSHSAGSTMSYSQTYEPGGVFAAVQSGSSFSDSTTSSAAAQTTLVTSASSSTVPSFVSTSFSTTTSISSLNEEVIVHEVFWEEEVITVTASVTDTVVVTATAAASAKKRHLHEHQRAHKRGHFA